MAASRRFIRVKADPENLTVIRGFIRLNSIALGTGRDQIGDIVIAVDEAVTNVILHGYRSQGGTVEIELEREGNYLVIYIRDQAPVFDPLEAPPPPLNMPLEERRSEEHTSELQSPTNLV